MSREQKTATDQIKPVLTSEQWAALQRVPTMYVPPSIRLPVDHYWSDDDIAEEMAYWNWSQSDSSRRKLNWDYVAMMRAIAGRLMENSYYSGWEDDPVPAELQLQSTADSAALLSIADVIASYLPSKEAEEQP